MDQSDRQVIENLFVKLSQVEQQNPSRDATSEHFIAGSIARQPAAPYYMAQTIVVQEQALKSAEAKIKQLEADLQSARQQPQPQKQSPFARGGAGPWGASTQQNTSARTGGGFLAGAAQTAMGVAGGMLLGNAIAGMFGGGAHAAEPAPQDLPPEEPAYDDPGVADDSGWGDEM